MKKFLLASLLFSVTSMMAEPPQTAFNLIGFNGETSASETNQLTYQPGDADDEEEGIYRYVNNEFVINDCADGFFAQGAEGMNLGFDEANPYGFENMVSQYSTMTSLAENGPAINCGLPAGTYKVILASFQEEGEPMTWTMMFQSVGGDTELSYYVVGINGMEELTQYNMLVKESLEDGDTFVYPKFLVEECPDGFRVATSDGTFLGLDPAFAEMVSEVNDDSPMAFLADGGAPVPCRLSPGYYSVTFASTGTANMISFIRCEDQTADDESVYYLLGFNGITAPSESVKFERTTEEVENEEDGTVETIVKYCLNGFEIKTCPDDGFTVSTEDGGFAYGLNSMFAAMLGDTVSEESPFGFMGIYGSPVKCVLPEGKYDISFIVTGTAANISFLSSTDSGVDGIGQEDNEQPVYYDLQGRRVVNPGKGIYIMRKGVKTFKIVR